MRARIGLLIITRLFAALAAAALAAAALAAAALAAAALAAAAIAVAATQGCGGRLATSRRREGCLRGRSG